MASGIPPTPKPKIPPMTMIKTLCKAFVERAEALNLKGKKREDAAFEFLLGAHIALAAVNHPEAEHVGTVTTFIIAIRGYSEVKRIAEAEDKAAA